MNNLISAYRTLIAAAQRRGTRILHFIEPLPGGAEIDEWRFTVEHVTTSAFNYPADAVDYPGPEDIGHPASAPGLDAIGACENLGFLIKLPIEYSETPQCIAPALEEFQQILDLLNDLSARVGALEAEPSNA